MASLPTPGQDGGVWGTMLNDYLSVSLAADGTVNAGTVGTSQLQDTSVTSAKLASGAVTTTILADGNVTKAKLESSVQTSLGKADTALQTAPVTSVATRTGDVILTRSDVGLDQVDNTSDLNKPISTAVQAALDLKASTIFDFTKSHPRFMVSFHEMTQAAPNHCTIKSADTGDYYSSQSSNGSNGTTSPYETMTVNRFGYDGVLLDSMQFTDGGHGTNIDLEYVNGTMYIWFPYQSPGTSGAANDLVRVPYVGGATITRDDASIQVMNKFGTDYVAVAFDWKNDYVAFRRGSTSPNTFELRKISEVKAGTNTVYHSINFSVTPPTFQGFTTIDDKLYISTGAVNEPSGDEDYIWVYNWTDGSLFAKTATGYLGKYPNGTYKGNSHEQENCSLYRDPITGQASLLVCVTVSTGSDSEWYLYMFPSLDADLFAPDIMFALENSLPVRMDGKSKRGYTGATSFAAVTQPGWWYFNATQTTAMTDHPATYTSTSSNWLQVSGADPTGAVIQTLSRDSTASPDQWVRIVSGGSAGPWVQTIHNNISGMTSGPDVSDQSYAAYSFPPECIQSGAAVTSGKLTGAKLRLPTDSTITYVVLGVNTAGSGLTSGQSGVAIYSSAGALLGSSADQSTTFNSAGMKTVALTSAVSVPAGYVNVVVWCVGTTLPYFVCGANLSAAPFNNNLSAANYRYYTADTGITTAATLPATLGTKSSSTAAWWFALR